jgi:aarF domain-containing kinase
VYRGVLSSPDGKKQDVAVKLIHPHVKKLIAVDMDIMRFFARFLELIPSIEYLSMGDIVEEFAKVLPPRLPLPVHCLISTQNMARQNDLRLEAKHLMKFRRNFSESPNIIFPEPIPGYVHENALVEVSQPTLVTSIPLSLS